MTTGPDDREQTGEFHRIARFFSPLAAEAPGALGLIDDAALIAPPEGCELAVSVDTLVEGVHFIGDEPPDQLARKALRVNLSDLAGMGATPMGYFLALSLPKDKEENWVAAFCKGMAQDQATFGCHLLGGDSTSTPGPICLTITAMGSIPMGKALRRSGARAGDGIFVSGTIGDGFLGLLAAQGKIPHGPEADWLETRYHLPSPRVSLGQALVDRASATMDISDGLVADLGHLCAASGCSARIQANKVPLSDAAAEILAEGPNLFPDLLTGGDDYELLIAGPEDEIQRAAEESGVPVTRIGTLEKGAGVQVVDSDDKAMRFSKSGFHHF